MTDERVQAEGVGETVGEARWAALRELERLVPGLAEADVEFVVLSEGERGLMGVGREPARVIAATAASRPPLGTRAERVADLVGRIALALDEDLRVQVHEDDAGIHALVTGEAAGVVIGRHGHTIDAIQHLVAAIVLQDGGERCEITVDAQGYRARRERRLRETAAAAAERALREAGPVELEPMSAAERRIVHLALAERADVETTSEGREPARYVVVSPTATP
jgi:spoIIIJ-associated protein